MAKPNDFLPGHFSDGRQAANTPETFGSRLVNIAKCVGTVAIVLGAALLFLDAGAGSYLHEPELSAAGKLGLEIMAGGLIVAAAGVVVEGRSQTNRSQ